MNGEDDLPGHDRFLREALRHAPDADAAPPPALRDTILREARAAVARPAMPSLGRRLRAALVSAWAALARPPFAAAFASLMVLTLAGVMWWGRPLEDALPERHAPIASPAAPVAAAAPPIEAAKPVPMPPPALQEAAPAGALKAEAERSDARRAAAAPAKRARAPVEQDHAARQATAKVAPAEPKQRAEEAAATSAPPAAAAPALPAPLDAQVASPATVLVDAPAPKAMARIAPASGAALQSLRRELAAPPPRLAVEALDDASGTWDRGDGRPRATDAAFKAWLAQLDAALATASRADLPGVSATVAGAAAPAPVAPLQVLRGGVVRSVLRFEGDAVVIESAGAAPRRLRLTPGAAQALAARLDELSR